MSHDLNLVKVGDRLVTPQRNRRYRPGEEIVLDDIVVAKVGRKLIHTVPFHTWERYDGDATRALTSNMSTRWYKATGAMQTNYGAGSTAYTPEQWDVAQRRRQATERLDAATKPHTSTLSSARWEFRDLPDETVIALCDDLIATIEHHTRGLTP